MKQLLFYTLSSIGQFSLVSLIKDWSAKNDLKQITNKKNVNTFLNIFLITLKRFTAKQLTLFIYKNKF